MIGVAKQMYSPTPMYAWTEVESIIVHDPAVFERALARVKRFSPREEALVTLCDACGIAKAVWQKPECYFCGSPYSRDEFLLGKTVQIEHFIPLSEESERIPGNLTLACSHCNRLKADFTSDDFRAILDDPDRFFAIRRVRESTRQMLVDFAEMIVPKMFGWHSYVERHPDVKGRVIEHWDDMRAEYRRKYVRR